MRSIGPQRLARVFALVAVVAAVAVPTALSFGFNDGNHPPDGVVGGNYSYQFSVDGGCKPYDFVVQNGSLPPGLAFDGNTRGLLTGVPTTAGSYFFWVEARDTGCSGGTCPPAGVSCTIPSQRPFTINIAPLLAVATDSLAPALVNVPYSLKLTATGGGDQTWSIVSGSLPPGLTLAANGTISGTATTAAAPVAVTVKVADASRAGTKAFQIAVLAPLAITQPTFAAAEVGHALAATTVVATGGGASRAWSATGQPAWLVIDAASGAISGTPTAAGSFPLQLSVKDEYGGTATIPLTVVVNAKVAAKPIKPSVTKVGKLFRATLHATGGVGAYTWKVTSGKFPIGIRLDRKTGILSGTARKAGKSRLTFTVSDTLGVTSKTTLTLTINPGAKKPKA